MKKIEINELYIRFDVTQQANLRIFFAPKEENGI